jgi:ABC-2 type transport system ATP-binding protein
LSGHAASGPQCPDAVRGHCGRFRVAAIRFVGAFDIEAGEFFGLLGPNGAGKTTLISVLAGLARASGGRVTVMGHDVVADYAAARKALGIVPQELVFDPFFSVRETLRIQSGYFGVRDNDAWIDELLAEPGPGRQGRRQHAAALRRHEAPRAGGAGPGAPPPVIVLDEPTAGVDVELRQTLWPSSPGSTAKATRCC